MGESKVTFGDKIFLYGQFTQFIEDFDEYEYNTVMGYMTVGGYTVYAIPTDAFMASIPGFVVEFPVDDQFTVLTPFSQAELVEVTDSLSLTRPLPSGTKVWMPIQVKPE